MSEFEEWQRKEQARKDSERLADPWLRSFKDLVEKEFLPLSPRRIAHAKRLEQAGLTPEAAFRQMTSSEASN